MRWRPSAGHILIELLYGIGDHIKRTGPKDDVLVHINITKMCKVVYMRPVRLLEIIRWLEGRGLILDLKETRYTLTMKIKAPEGPNEVRCTDVQEPPKKAVEVKIKASEAHIPNWMKRNAP